MAYPARVTCKVPGCGKPVHVFPGGWKCSYCREHRRLRKSTSRDGLPAMSGAMKDVLRYLREQKRQGWPFVELRWPLAHDITITSLLERDWMAESPGEDGKVLYAITGRGEKALKIYEPARNRRDGICPRCGERPRHTRKSGTRCAYCTVCERERSRKKNARQRRKEPRKLCARCGQRPRHQYPSGVHEVYCQECERERGRSRSRLERRKLREGIRAGGPVPSCRRCGQRPAQVFPNSVSKNCRECNRAYFRGRKLKQVMEKHGLGARS